MSDILYYFVCALLSFGVLTGISMMSKVKTAATGNLLSAVFTALAIVLTLYKNDLLGVYSLWLCMAASTVVGFIWAGKIKMIEMPQIVALLNGFGGMASGLVAIVTLLESNTTDAFELITGGLALAVGMVTLTGSLVAGGKLHKVLAQKPVVWPGHQFISTFSLILSVACIIVIGMNPVNMLLWVIVCSLISSFFGIAFSIRVGGADMPITISLLNSLSGVAGSIAGMAIGDPLLVAIGGVVGASGLLLTQIMCRAMNRSLSDILMGKTSVSSPPKAVSSPTPIIETPVLPESEPIEKEPVEELDMAKILKESKKVIIIPGYGMALAQAQELVKELCDTFESGGAEVDFAIHPVAGRMPGHMNVLLAEVDVPYEKLQEMDDINPMFAECDLAIVIGANDVVNPAARNAEDTPIYGMPILEVDTSKHIIICNFDRNPGYSGVDNPLYDMQGVMLMLGDAKDTVQQLIDKYKN